MRHQAAADERHVGGRIEPLQLAHRVADEHVGADRQRARRSATQRNAEPTPAAQCGDGVEPLGMPRHEHEQQRGKALPQQAIRLEDLALLAGVRAHGTTIVLNSHQLDQVERVCDRVAFLRDGKVQAIEVLHAGAEAKRSLRVRFGALRIADVPSDAPAHRASWEIRGTTLEGDRWSAPLHIPFTRFRQDARWGLALDGKGNAWAAWPMDNRDYEEFLFEHGDIYAAKLPALSSASAAPKLVARRDEEIPVFPVHLEEEKERNRRP